MDLRRQAVSAQHGPCRVLRDCANHVPAFALRHFPT